MVPRGMNSNSTTTTSTLTGVIGSTMATSLSTSVTTAKPTEWTCQQCGHSFTRAHGLKRHIESVHEHKQAFQCHICQQAFTLKSVLTDHLLTHSGVSPYQCEQCEESFKSRRTRSRHVLKVHGTSTKSDNDLNANLAESNSSSDEQKSKTRKRPRSTETTIADASSSASPFLCGICAQTFSTDILLHQHMIVTHFDSTTPRTVSSAALINGPVTNHEVQGDEHDTTDSSSTVEFGPPTKKKRSRPSTILTCPYASTDGCTQTFHYRHVLNNHIRSIHTLETPFACKVCQRKFPTLARQVKHESSHLKLMDAQ